jgi:signal transduction histidine kinase/CheY-like chemotaxis protein
MSSDEPGLRARSPEWSGAIDALLRGWSGASSAFGPPQVWPVELKALVPSVLRSPLPTLLWWGPRFLQIHNEACRAWLEPQYASVFGAPGAEVWAGAWERLELTLNGVLATGIGAYSAPITLPAFATRMLESSSYTFACTPVLSERGQVSGVLASLLNATQHAPNPRQFVDLALRERLLSEREQLLTSEQSARAEAEAANRAKDEFLAMLGHELRNPLSPMLTALELMRLRGEQSREQAVIERQVGHLVRLVDDLLDVSRITRGKIELRKAPVELSSIVVRAVEIASPLFERRDQRLELAVPEQGLIVDADADRLAQVVANLLTNASKYSHVGAYIWVSAQPIDGRVWLRVRDEGIGIAPEMLQSVFTAFVQHRQSLDRASGGLGLGLAIVQSLVGMHGGHVEARSAGLGKGSEFVVSLPLSAAVLRTSQPPAVPHALVAPASVEFGILVVDDNEDAADLLAQTLSRLGYQTRVARDGPSALELAATFRPAVALLDIGLPVMDGYELAQRLLDLPDREQPLRLIAVTGYGQPSDRLRSERAGFSAHLVKPVSIEQLIEALRVVGKVPTGSTTG